MAQEPPASCQSVRGKGRLGEQADTAGGLPGGQPRQVPAVEQYRAARGPVQSAQPGQERALPTAVRSDDGGQAAGWESEPDGVHGDRLSVGEGEVVGA
ncbi:hypothetical protein GCM10023097_74220 [Streptomyces collinus]